MNYRSRKAASIIFGLLSAAGTVITAILVAKETPKAIKKIDELKQKQTVKKMDYIKALIPIYWPAGLVCLGTITSTTISQVISIKTEASLIAATTIANQGWMQYKGKVKQLLGVNADKAVTNSTSTDEYNRQLPKVESGKQLFWEEHIGFFSCTKDQLLAGLNDLNQRLHTPDPSPDGTCYYTSLYFLIKDSHACVYNKDIIEGLKEYGWTTDYMYEVWTLSCMWVHPCFTKVVKKETGEVLYTKLSFWEEPITLIDSERSRYHYESREDFKHDAENDINESEMNSMYDEDAYQLSTHGYQDDDMDEALQIEKELVYNKPDCHPQIDNGRRFMPTDQNAEIEYIEEDPTLPSEKDIPKNL